MVSDPTQYAVLANVSDGSHELRACPFPEVIGPVDFGLAMQDEADCLCIGSGVLAGGIIPGSNRLIFTGRSPVWGGFYVSTMGGAGLIWDGTGVSFLAIAGRADNPSVLVLSGEKGRYPKLRVVPVEVARIWGSDAPGGMYALQEHVFNNLWDGKGTPRVLATGPSALHTDFGAIASSKTSRGKLTAVDCWAGRGGFGSALLQRHNICAIVYGGDFEDEDLTDRAEADGYFQQRFSKTMKLVDLEATTKYRFDPKFSSGGTFGVNYSRLMRRMLSFNYRSIHWSPEKRYEIWERLVRDHYLAQFNDETIAKKQFAQCGEPCPAVCKKLHGEFKKDYEPYQTMGPLIGVFDQRVAERVNHRADALGFDGIQIGGHLAWVMECLYEGLITPADLGLPSEIPQRPVFDPEGFDPVTDSAVNGDIALALLDLCVQPGHLLSRGTRAAAAVLGPEARSRAVYLANGADGWMIPNQYWVPGMFAPQAVMGKYYVYYGDDYLPPRELGSRCAERMVAELTTDNAGMCRFHRGWSEKLWPEIVQQHYDIEVDYRARHNALARRIHEGGRPVCWESERVGQLVHRQLEEVRPHNPDNPDLASWLHRFGEDEGKAARAYWSEVLEGIREGMNRLS